MNTLSEQEILFFKEEGYLVKRNVLDPRLMAYARERLWEAAPSQLKRDQLETWIGPFEEKCEDKMSYRSGYRWNYRQPGGEPWMIELLPKNPSVWHMAEQLLGKGTLREPDRGGGI